MRNVLIEEPSQGTLLSMFNSSTFQNITVDRCRCGTLPILLEGVKAVQSKVELRQLEEQLEDEIFCYKTGRSHQPIRPPVCFKETQAKDFAMEIVIGVFLCLALAFLALLCHFYGWHKRLQKKHAIFKKMSFISPNTVREEAVVQFNEEVQYFPRPESTVFTVATLPRGKILYISGTWKDRFQAKLRKQKGLF